MPLALYGINHCDTVKRARAWFVAQGASVLFHDFKKSGVPELALDHWIAAVGWQRLLNRQGRTWRQLPAATQEAVVCAASARALMQAHSSLIKRPVVAWPDGSITVGFDPDAFSHRL